jgi:hypothetical protein
MAQRNRYVKLALFEASSTNVMGGVVVGQTGDYLLIERPAPKPRAAATKTRKPRATKISSGATQSQPATAFPGAGVTSGA